MAFDFSSLPVRVRKDLLVEYGQKLDSRLLYKGQLEQTLLAVNEDVIGYENLGDALLETLTNSVAPISPLIASPVFNQKLTELLDEVNQTGNKNSNEGAYNANWSYFQKIAFVVRDPKRYGFIIFAGSNNVVEAILVEEPDLLLKDEKSIIRSRIAPVISRMVEREELIKYRLKGTVGRSYFVSPEWFDENKQIKPEYAEALEGMEQVAPGKTLAPAVTGANNEVTERNGGHPSTHAVGNLNGSISLRGNPNPTIFE